MQIDGNVFVVTGGGNGIGRQVVLQLLQQGAHVAAVDRSDAALNDTAALAGPGAAATLSLHSIDITDRTAVAALPDSVAAAHGRVDGVINVAGIIHRFARLQDLEFDEIERVMAVNFWGTVLTVRAFLPVLLARPAASIVNVASLGGLVPVPGQGAYGASKAAVKLFTETLYSELRDTSVQISLVIPGGVLTNIVENSGLNSFAPAAAGNGKQPKITTPEQAASSIIGAVVSGRLRTMVGSDAKGLERISRLAPKRAIDLVTNQMRSLLGATPSTVQPTGIG